MDSTGKVLEQHRPLNEYQFKGAAHRLALLERAHHAVRTKQSDTARDELSLIEAVNDPDETKFEELKEVAKKSGIDPDIKAAFEELVRTWPIQKARRALQKAGRAAGKDQDKIKEAKRTFASSVYDLYKKHVAVDDLCSELFDDYWLAITHHSIDIKDQKTGATALDHLEKKYADNKRAMEFLKNLRVQLGEPPSAGS